MKFQFKKTHVPDVSWTQQSPIELGQSLFSDELPQLRFHYPKQLHGHFNHKDPEDHDFYVTQPSTASVIYDGHTCPLLKIHFHMPAEHMLKGKTADLEAHLVHAVPSFPGTFPSAFLVVGVFYDVQTKPPQGECEFESLLKKLFFHDQQTTEIEFNPNEFLPKSRKHFYRYEGSLTTEPFTELVSWIVMKDHARLDTPIEYKVVEHSTETARKPQPLNRRFVLRNFR